MLNEDAFYHRTAKGLAEIQHKTHGLTQSERLVLIIVDGVTSYGGLREKLKGLAEGRFESALLSLLGKDLVEERDTPEAEPAMEFLNSGLIAGFLRQDPLDPVTVISPDVQLEDRESGIPKSLPSSSEELVLRPGKITKVDIYLPLEPVVRATELAPKRDVERVSRPISAPTNALSRVRSESKLVGNLRVESAWVFFVSLVLLILFIVLQIAS